MHLVVIAFLIATISDGPAVRGREVHLHHRPIAVAVPLVDNNNIGETGDGGGSTTCPVAVGAPVHYWQWFFDDESHREWDVQMYTGCDGSSYGVIVPGSMQVFCPVSYPCLASLPATE